ncbi:hypothetical protein CVT26_007938 [Gymnopilus dilepis]|uniref:Uncharacterized protein n=1 Tax=Gymnopilus dilepis TaxID=231916 RepID=A0A409W7V2_9AGAR|nr:hypothetical protein CVT26_007938 [Gymnopilus dilepis]
MAIPPACKYWADLNEPGRYKLYRPCENTGATENCEACLELKKVEDEISKAMKVVEGLFERHREVRTRLNHAHDPVVHKVPPEITSYIFQLSLPPWPEDSNLRNMAGIDLQAPTILSAVCTAWKRVAFSTPQLWAYSRVSLTKAKKREMKELDGRCSFFHERLRRSGRVPLTICLTANWRVSDYSPATDLVRAIVQCSDRWRVLDLDCSDPLSDLLVQTSHRAPNLQVLRLRIGSIKSSTTFIASEGRPKEIYLALTKLNEIVIDWRRVTSIHLSRADPDDCTSVLQLAPLLEQCHFSDSFSRRFGDPPATNLINLSIIHNGIRKLTLQKAKGGSTDEHSFLEKLTLPALQSLTFPGFAELTPAIIGLVKRSCCTVREITFTDTDDQQVVRVLKEVPSLQRMICCTKLAAKAMDGILQFLLDSGEDSDSKPTSALEELEHIQFIVASPEITWPLLGEFIRPLSGALKRPSLVSVKIEICHGPWSRYLPEEYIDSTSLQRLQEAWKEGLNVQLLATSEEQIPVVMGYDIIQATLDPVGWRHITKEWGQGGKGPGIRPLTSDDE